MHKYLPNENDQGGCLMNCRSFKKGGVHPDDNKLSSASPIKIIKTPDFVNISLNQHIGSPAESIVKIDQEVKRGQLIAKASSFVSANIHSSINGKVTKVDKNTIRIEKTDSSLDYLELDTENKSLIEIIKDAGIVGKGGAGFPSHVKLSPKDKDKITTILVNAAECEPYLTSDHRLIIEKAKELIYGIKLVLKEFNNISKVIIGVENNKADAINILNAITKNELQIEVLALKTRYPQGGEKQLIQALLNKEVPSGGLPFEIGIIVLNVATIIAIYQAYFNKKPLIDTVVTISGDLCKEPSNLLIPIGTEVAYIANECNIEKEKINKVIFGGPMMGFTINSLSTSINKTTSGILFFENKISVKERNCINCGMCVDVCSLGLLPTKYAKYSKFNKIDEALEAKIMDCTECGCCSYICPAKIEIVAWIKLLKNKIRNLNKKEGK